jgi:hypothetical protein
MKVTNINGTTANICSCGSWLAHWKNYSGQALPRYCPEETCTDEPTLGAHVQKDSTTDRKWYIVPLCSKHNAKKGESINISNHIKLVSANVSETCGK